MLKKQLTTVSAMNRKYQDTIKNQEKKIKELQKIIMIERQQNFELTEMLNKKAETDNLADQYIRELLLSHYQDNNAVDEHRRNMR